MAYKKGKGYTKRRTFKKRAAYKKPMRYQVADMAYNAYKGVSYLKNLINVETKYFDTAISGTVNQTGSVRVLNLIPQGITQGQRVGDSVKLQHLAFKGFLSMNNTTAYNNLRIIIFKGDRENSSVPATTWLLESGQIFDNKTWRDRFQTRVIFDKIYSFSNTGALVRNVEWNFKLGWHCNYVPAATTIEDGGLYLLTISDNSTDMPSMTGNFRVLYTDD